MTSLSLQNNGFVLLTENLTKKFGGVLALNNVTLALPEKTITMIIGPNGSGKTTLINVISGVYRPDSGTVKFRGVDITGWPPHRIYKVGIVRTFQVPSLFLKLTVLENVLVAARNNPGESPLKAILMRKKWVERETELAEKAFKILKMLRIDHMWDRRACELSGGQMKLLELARVLLSEPKLILMDEPIAGVNPSLAKEILGYIRQVRDKLGIPFLIVEHRLDIVLDYVDYAYAMHNGRIIAHGDPYSVLKNERVVEAYLGEPEQATSKAFTPLGG